MTTRYIGHPDAPSFTYRASKRFKIRPESLAYSIMDDLICRIHIYDDMAEDELRRGFFKYIPPVYAVLITCIDDRGHFIYPQDKQFNDAATRIIRNKPHTVYDIFYYVAKEVIDLLLETKQEYEMKQRSLYYSNQPPRYV